MSKSVTRKVLQGKDNVIEVVGFCNITKLLLFMYVVCNFIESGCFNKSIFLN